MMGIGEPSFLRPMKRRDLPTSLDVRRRWNWARYPLCWLLYGWGISTFMFIPTSSPFCHPNMLFSALLVYWIMPTCNGTGPAHLVHGNRNGEAS